MEKISNLLREQNIKVTPQRICVYDVLFRSQGHLSADEVHKRVQKKMPAVSLATVYSILEYLRDKKLVRVVKIDAERSFYEAKQQAHHHFLCRQCKEISDVDIGLCPTLVKCHVQGHAIDDFQGYFYGTCKHCLK